MIDQLRSTDRAEILAGCRDVLAAAIEVADPSEVAALVRQMVSVSAELSAIAVPEVSRVDELAAGRDKRRTAASASRKAARGK